MQLELTDVAKNFPYWDGSSPYFTWLGAVLSYGVHPVSASFIAKVVGRVIPEAVYVVDVTDRSATAVQVHLDGQAYCYHVKVA